MGVSIDENEMVGWLDIRPIITSDCHKRIIGLGNCLLDDLRELADLLMVC